MKILYTATVLSHICQFHIPYLQAFQESGAEVHVAARDNLSEKNGLTLKFTDRFIPIPFQRSPKSPQNIRAYYQLKALIEAESYDLIICNTPMGGIVTRLAARHARKKGTRVVYIAHGFHFYHGAPKKNWLIFYPIERLFSRITDLTITIVEEDSLLAREKFHSPVAHIHGIGVSPQRYHPVSPREQFELREHAGLASDDFVILCTGELNRNKDQATLLRAAAQIKSSIPNLKILLAGNGPLEQELRTLSKSLNLENIVHFLGYRTDLERIVPAVDLIVSCSHREGMPLNIIEAMLCAKPVVAAKNRGTCELIDHQKTGLLFTPSDIAALSSSILTIYHTSARSEMGHAAQEKAQIYTIEIVKAKFMLLIKDLLNGQIY